MTWPPPNAAARMLATFASAFVALACPLRCPAAEAASPTELRIAAVRMGFLGTYKLGCWTQLTVEIEGGANAADGRVEATTHDADGVPATVAAPVRLEPGATAAARLFVRYGQDGAPLTVRVVDDDGRELASRTLHPSSDAGEGALRIGLPATSRLLATFGLRAGLTDLLRDERSGFATDAPRAARLESADDLPTEWYGYEGVETVVLGASQPELYDELSADDPRIAALARWVELGGQLVVFFGADSPELFAEGGPLAQFLPGEFTGEFAPLPDFKAIEIFSDAEIAITRIGARLNVPQLADVHGRAVADGGRAGAELPLVVRERRGLGEVTFVAVDPDAPPLDEWSERPSLLRQALGWPTIASSTTTDSGGSRGAAGDDVTNVLGAALDRQFAGVSAAPFALVAALVLAYVALIGHGDYFLLKRLNRPQLTWVTFPAIVLGSCAAAWWFAYQIKGDELRVSQLEIIDVDVTTGQARGTVWTHVFSPTIERFDLTLEPRFGRHQAGDRRLETGGEENADSSTLQSPASSLQSPQQLLAWFGSPGFGLGGMRGQRGMASLFDRGYQFDPELNAMHGVPVEQWSTKALTARWTATLDAALDARLEAMPDDIVSGRIENRTGVDLDDCLLIHGRWAYALPPLPAGGATEIDDSTSPRTIRTALTSAAAGDDPNVRTTAGGGVMFDPATSDVARIAKMMMFYNAIGGAAYVGLPHRYQAFIDMSALVRGDQAVLLARAPAEAASAWIDGDRPLASDEDRRWVYCRFVIPLEQLAGEEQRDSRPTLGPSPIPGSQ